MNAGAASRALRDLYAGVLVFGREGGVLLANRAALRLLGLDETATLGRPVDEVLRSSEPPKLRRLVRQGEGTLETTLSRPDGGETAVGLHVSRLDAGDGPPGSVMLISDLTEIRRIDEQVRRRDRLASLGQLSAGIAHEIKNPLTAITTCTEVLRTRLPAEDARREFLDLILHEVTRLTRIVDTFIQFARPATPRLSLCPLEDCVDVVLSLLRESIERQCVRVVRESPDPPPPPLFIDRDQMVQVLLNVILNALQAMPEGGALTVGIHLAEERVPERRAAGRRASDPPLVPRRSAGARRVAHLRVTDTGTGIPPENQPRLFDPFFTSRPEGTGLGLPIALAIVQEHGGTMRVDSAPGDGTTVTIELPVEKRQGADRPGQGGRRGAASMRQPAEEDPVTGAARR